MTVTPVIRILRFRPIHVGFDGVLREAIPALRATVGLLDVVAWRHGPEELGPRMVASVWASSLAMSAAVENGGAPANGSFDPFIDTAEVELEIRSLSVLFRAESPEPPRVLRAFRGQVRPGELDAYVEEARHGTELDVSAGRGPLALYLAPTSPGSDGFLTLSTWPDWSVIEAATGGDVHQPIATRHAERLVASDVTHYEAIEI